MPTAAELLAGHVTLTVESLDRMYLNGYIPKLQIGDQLRAFLINRRDAQIASPALLRRMNEIFRCSVKTFVTDNGAETHKFKRGERKEAIAAAVRARGGACERVYLVGTAQEKCSAFKGSKETDGTSGHFRFEFSRESVFVTQYYFYLFDEDFGPAFIKVGTYAPYPIRVCLNGHEWLKRQLDKEGIAYRSLDNGILSCSDPEQLQRIANRLGPDQIAAFFSKWLRRLPLPLSAEDRAAGYDWRLSVWQAEISRTQVFDRPLRGRQFFEEVIRENLDLGRPERVQLLFDRRITRKTPGRFLTRVIHDGVHPQINLRYKSCDIKQYFKNNRALRTETTINNTYDFGVGRDLKNLWELRRIGTDINRRLLDTERVSQHCSLSQDTVGTITRPTVTEDGKRASALRFGDPRAMALFAALFLMCHLPEGFTNRTLRTHVADLLGPDSRYGAGQMGYDLRRLRRKGLVHKLGNTHRYRLTAQGLQAAAFFTKLDERLFRVANATISPPDGVPRPLRKAMDHLRREVDTLLETAKLNAA